MRVSSGWGMVIVTLLLSAGAAIVLTEKRLARLETQTGNLINNQRAIIQLLQARNLSNPIVASLDTINYHKQRKIYVPPKPPNPKPSKSEYVVAGDIE